jgi:hypothetical protein
MLVAKKENIDFDALSEFGEVEIVDLETLFGY